jgi:hypothetical protein
LLTTTLTAAIALIAGGCGGDKSTGPDNDNSAFDQPAAVTQAAVAAPQAVALAQSITALAGGVGGASYVTPRGAAGARPVPPFLVDAGATGGTYGWNAETMRWEYRYLDDETDYDYDWTYTVQYRDSDGVPLQFPTGAALLHHTMHGTMDYASSQSGYNLTYNYMYDYDVTITGLGTSLFTMAGSGGYDIDYQYVGNGVNQDINYAVDWETLGGGITVAPGGCPSGTIRYTFAPYHLDVVFNGSSSATYTLYDGGGGTVAAGSGTYPVFCGS